MTWAKLVQVAKRLTLTPKVSKMTKANCPEWSTVSSSFLDFHDFRKRDREKEKERASWFLYKEVRSFLIFLYPNCYTLNSLAQKNVERDFFGQADCRTITL